MIRRCRQKKIYLVLVKSISRFARNTTDYIRDVRELLRLGISICLQLNFLLFLCPQLNLTLFLFL